MESDKRSGPVLNESFKHRVAKYLLARWLRKKGIAKREQKFGSGSFVFRPDVTTFTDGHVQSFYEVVHKNEIDAMKLAKMQYYCYLNNLDILLHEVNADWILNQVTEPEKIESFTFDLSPKL